MDASPPINPHAAKHSVKEIVASTNARAGDAFVAATRVADRGVSRDVSRMADVI